MGYLLPFDRSIRRSQDFGANPGWGPNPPGGHNGDDWATPVGTPVRAAGNGVVVFAGEFDDTYADNWGWNLHYGGLMVILNMDGETAPYFEYGHNSRLLVKAGERVVRGQVIALTGNTDGGTGVSTGPHCHVGCLPHNFNLGTSTYGRVNPRLYMTDYPDSTGSLSYAGETIKPIDRGFLMALTDKQQEDIYWMLCAPDGRQFLADLVGGRAAEKTLNTPVKRYGSGLGGETNLAGFLAWNDAHVDAIVNAVSAVAPAADLEAIKAAVREGLAGSIEVNATVSVKEAEK